MTINERWGSGDVARGLRMEEDATLQVHKYQRRKEKVGERKEE